MEIELISGSSTAKICTTGAELVSLKDVFGMEYIWQKDEKYWPRSSPVLFPVVGNLRNGKTVIEGKEYRIPQHGFCRDAEFQVTYHSDTTAVFTYSFSDQTLLVYPYRFSLTLSYTLDNTCLSIRYTVMNLDDRPMNYFIGAHPAFNTPVDEGSFEECCLDFEKPETAACPVYDLNECRFHMGDRIQRLQNESHLRLCYSDFQNDAIVFDAPNSRWVRLHNLKTGRGVQVDFGDFDYIAFWTPVGKNAPFLCIEPWCGMADCDDETGEFALKRGVKQLSAGEQQSYELKITML